MAGNRRISAAGTAQGGEQGAKRRRVSGAGIGLSYVFSFREAFFCVLITLRREKSSRSFYSRESVIYLTVEVSRGRMMFFKALARFWVLFTAVASR